MNEFSENESLGPGRSFDHFYFDTDSQCMSLQKIQTQIDNETSDQQYRIQFIMEDLSVDDKEQIHKIIYNNNIHQEDIILMILFIFIGQKFKIPYNRKSQFDDINNLMVLKQFFKTMTKPEIIRNSIDKTKNFIKESQENLQYMASIWLELNKFQQDGEDLLNYHDAFIFMNTILKYQSQKFDDFLKFLVNKNYNSEIIITSKLYNQIIQFFFPSKKNNQTHCLPPPLIQEFINDNQKKLF